MWVMFLYKCWQTWGREGAKATWLSRLARTSWCAVWFFFSLSICYWGGFYNTEMSKCMYIMSLPRTCSSLTQRLFSFLRQVCALGMEHKPSHSCWSSRLLKSHNPSSTTKHFSENILKMLLCKKLFLKAEFLRIVAEFDSKHFYVKTFNLHDFCNSAILHLTALKYTLNHKWRIH